MGARVSARVGRAERENTRAGAQLRCGNRPARCANGHRSGDRGSDPAEPPARLPACQPPVPAGARGARVSSGGLGPCGIHSPPRAGVGAGAGPGAPMAPRRAASWSERGRTCRQAEGPEGTAGALLTCQRLKGPGRPGEVSRLEGGRDLRIYTPLGAAGGGSVRPAAARAPSLNPESDPGSAAFRAGYPLPERVQSGSPQEPAPPAARPRPWESETFAWDSLHFPTDTSAHHGSPRG